MSIVQDKTAFSIRVQDVSGQRTVTAAGITPDSTIRELVEGLVPKMGLAESDVEGRPLNYHARLDREGRHLHGSIPLVKPKRA